MPFVRQIPLRASCPSSTAEQRRVADLTYVAIAVGFVYVALIMGGRSRRIVGHVSDRWIDARLT